MSILARIYMLVADDNIHLRNDTSRSEEWTQYINSLTKPKDSIDQAYNKYLCRQFFFSSAKRFFFDIVGLLLMAVEMPLLICSRRHETKKKENLLVIEKHNDVDYIDVVPEILYSKYKKVEVIPNINTRFGKLYPLSRKYVLSCIRRHPFCFFFHYFVFKECLAHDMIWENYCPDAVAVYVNERNVATPILKDIYNNRDCKIISFMHGEYLLNLIQAYMSFSEFYVWDEMYIGNFKEFLKCTIDKYIVYTPRKLQKKWDLEKYMPEYDYTYYFTNETIDTIKAVAKVLSVLERNGMRGKIRPHPRHMDNLKIMQKQFITIRIEDPRKISMKESLQNTKYAIGLMTTVLSEAEIEGREIVLDDISNPALFDKLRDRRFRLLTHKHMLLSELVDLDTEHIE